LSQRFDQWVCERWTAFLKYLRDRYNARRRALDIQILWPACKEQAATIDYARAAFAMHAFNDEAWTCLGDEEIKRIITTLS
jgi:hypothetical protein